MALFATHPPIEERIAALLAVRDPDASRGIRDDRALHGAVVQRPAGGHRPRGMRIAVPRPQARAHEGRAAHAGVPEAQSRRSDSGHRRPGRPGRRRRSRSRSRAPSRSTPPRKPASSCRGIRSQRALALQWLMYRRHRLRVGVDDGLFRNGAPPGEVAGQSRVLRGASPAILPRCRRAPRRIANGLPTSFRSRTSRCIRSAPSARTYIDSCRRPAESDAVDGGALGAAGRRQGHARGGARWPMRWGRDRRCTAHQRKRPARDFATGRRTAREARKVTSDDSRRASSFRTSTPCPCRRTRRGAFRPH